MYSPREDTMTMKEAMEIMSPELRARFMADGSATISTDPVVKDSFEESKAFIIKNFGVYEIKRRSPEAGRDIGYQESPTMLREPAVVYTSIVDFDMTSLPVSLAIFFHNGAWSFQDRIAGTSYTGSVKIPAFISRAPEVESFLPQGTYRPVHDDEKNYGQVHKDLAMPKLGTVVFVANSGVATVPVTIKSLDIRADGVILHGLTAMNKSITLIPSNVSRVIQKVDDNTYLIPTHLKVVYLGPKLVSVASDPADYVKVASSSMEIISDGSAFAFRGHPCLRKLGADTTFLNRRDALFLSASLGLSVPFAEKVLEEAAESREPVRVFGIRPIVTEAEKLASVRAEVIELAKPIARVKTLLLKEAAALPDEDTVDKVLALNFITPENASIFHRNLPGFVMTASKLAELLIGIRIGLKDVPEIVVQRAMSALQGVIEALSQLRYNQARPA
jgi:hypothetical protein